MWLAAENGMFLRSTKGEWMTTMPEHLNMDWVECVKVRVMVLFGNDMIMNSWLVDE